MADRLKEIFKARESFMNLIRKHHSEVYKESWPLDISKKSSQKVLRETALKGVEEMFEALGHLKNWKSHRVHEIPEVDKEEFLEEIIDAFNYFYSLMILSGFNEDDFYKAFIKKDQIIRDRLSNKY